jgi:hypothetical protein
MKVDCNNTEHANYSGSMMMMIISEKLKLRM